MKKILLVGELGAVVRSLNECLSEKYAVQICSNQLDNVQKMVKIIKPDMIVICYLGMEDTGLEIFQWLERGCKTVPILIITTTIDWERCREYCQSDNIDKMFRPISKEDLLDRCRRMLGQKDEFINETIVDRKKRILIVDDSPMVLRHIKDLLTPQYDVFLSTSGEQALKMIPTKNPDLILLDYDMPGMDGKETFETILENNDMKHIPVVFLTSVAKRQQIYDVVKSIPAGYILKPPDRNRLLKTIEDVFTGKNVSDEI